MKNPTWRQFVLLGLVTLVIAVVTSCTTPQGEARLEAQRQAEQRQPYVQQNDIEFNNYNARQKIADDPTTILWCTSAFPVPSSPLFTVPVVGKLTSGNKRPYATGGYGSLSELPGPDGMYGSSGEYRYGFTPAGVYVDFYNISTFCTTEPTIWQRESTEIVLQIDPDLLDAQRRAREALQKGNNQEATEILEEAIKKAQRR